MKNQALENFPLCVDLDGTLIKSDSLLEAFLILIKRNPFYLFLSIFWLVKGKAYFKARIAYAVDLNPAFLPYTEDFLAFLREQYRLGRPLTLVTAAHHKIARHVADHIGIFTEVVATEDNLNLKGIKKQRYLTDRFGKKGYDYAGNEIADIPVWQDARKAIIVNAKPDLIAKVKQLTTLEYSFGQRKNYFTLLLKAIRIHQSLKNLLIFAPLIIGHFYFNLAAVISTVLAFLCFSLMTSSVYLLNDLLDLKVDRQHRIKSKRVFAAGDLPISYGIILAPILLSAAFALAIWLSIPFALVLLVYYLLTLSYSFYLKQKLLIDVFLLAILYTARIVAGTVVLNTDYSIWLLTFSLFFFMSLALVKRYSEIYFNQQENKVLISGRGYHVSDLLQLQIFGTVSGYIAALVFALYINSEKVTTLYQHPNFLWLVWLVLLFWISRIWMLASRGQIHEDPVLFALNDKISIASFGIIFFTVILATL